MDVLEMQEKLAEKKQERDTFLSAFKDDGSDFTDEANVKAKEMNDEIKKMEKDLERVQSFEQIKKDRAAAQARKGSPEKQLVKRFSFLRMLRSQLATNDPHYLPLEGAEKEAHREAEDQASGADGKSRMQIKGVGVPSFFMLSDSEREMIQERALSAGTSTSGAETVDTVLQDLIGFLAPRLTVEAMGATVMTGLTGDLYFPRNDSQGSGAWEGEVDTGAEIDPSFDNVQMSPNRFGGYTIYSKQLLIQSSIGVEGFVRNNISSLIGQAVDTVAINGSGSGNQPTGILNTSNIGDVDHGANGGAVTWPKVLEFLSDIQAANADMGSLGWLTTPEVKAQLMQVEKATNTAQFIMQDPGDSLVGYPFRWSNLVPKTLTDGSGSSLHAMIFGNWQELMIGQWGPIDFVVDPYSLVRNAQVQVVANIWVDVAVKHPASFTAAQDIDVT